MTEKPEPEVTKILQNYRVVAVVGLSPTPGAPATRWPNTCNSTVTASFR